ncbi:MAG: hypothetical protein AB201_02980 [Parcubacteria bacterium C7867-006]|nr:MAG: hypothetical protein AB201_02980 [Parcubacteria bacterium C7867-006]
MEDIAKESKTKKIMVYIWTTLAIIIFFSVFFAYHLGYRFKDNLTVGKIGHLNMTIPMPLTSVFIDNSQKIETSKDNEQIKISLSPKTHSVIVARDGYFPWTKSFVVPSNGNITVSPIFVSQNASGQIITQKDPEYWQIRSNIIRNIIPKKDNPISSTDKTVTLWVDDNAIYVKNNEVVTKVIQPDTVVKNVSFYKDRNDAVIFSTTNSIFVIETDTSSAQNFMPIYRGTSPNFIKTDPNFIYVLDGDVLMQVII